MNKAVSSFEGFGEVPIIVRDTSRADGKSSLGKNIPEFEKKNYSLKARAVRIRQISSITKNS